MNVLLEFYQKQNNPLEYIYGNGQMISRDDLLVLPVSKRLVYQNSHWFHQDGLGSVVNLTNATDSVSLTYGYDAFGEITKEQGQVGWKKNRYAFTGKPYDPSSGMYYFGARWYEAKVGRFVSKDPLSWKPDDPRVLKDQNDPIKKRLILEEGAMESQITHKYVYCRNNPINYVDPTGEKIYYATPLLPGIYWEITSKLKDGDSAVFPLYPFTAGTEPPTDVALWYLVSNLNGKFIGRFYFGPLHYLLWESSL